MPETVQAQASSSSPESRSTGSLIPPPPTFSPPSPPHGNGDGSTPSTVSGGPQPDESSDGVPPEPEPEWRICGPVKVPFTVMFEDLEYKVKLPTRLFKKPVHRTVLKGISGRVRPGELLALMGPSGSGKTTLLNVIGDRVRNKKDITGTILFNGRKMSRYVRRYMAFVLQDDLLFAHLTVRETLRYAALLKLPNTMKWKDKIATVENVIKLLRLERCANTKIGGPFARGVSGGERKRCSIGVEMLNNPSILMMDEPTSGLDSFVAAQVIEMLKEIAVKEGRTIIVSIHQPSTQVFYTFDRLLLLDDGRVVFRGPLSKLVPMFEDYHVPPPPNYNPSDYMMEIMANRRDLVDEWVENMKQQYVEESALEADNPTNELEGVPNFEKLPIYEMNFFQQFAILFVRSFKQQFFTIISWNNIFQALTISVLSGLFWLQIPYTESRITDRYALVFFLIVVWSFNSFIITINSYPAERGVVWKERKAKYYRLSAYMFAKWITESMIIIIIPLIAVTITYFIAHLNYDFLSWFETVLVVILNVWVLQGFAMMLAVVVPSYQQAVVLGTTFLLLSMLLGGFYIKTLPNWLIWCKYLSVIYYAVSLAEAIQFENTTFYCDVEPSQFLPCTEGEPTFSGSLFLADNNNWDVWGLNFGVLMGLLVISRFLTYLALRPQV